MNYETFTFGTLAVLIAGTMFMGALAFTGPSIRSVRKFFFW